MLLGKLISIISLIVRVNTGELPPVDMPMITGDLSIKAGMMNEQSDGSSTTLTGIPNLFASFATFLLTLKESVAAITSVASVKCLTLNSSLIKKHLASGKSLNFLLNSIEIILTIAPDFRTALAFLCATSPPPTITHFLFFKSRNTGK